MHQSAMRGVLDKHRAHTTYKTFLELTQFIVRDLAHHSCPSMLLRLIHHIGDIGKRTRSGTFRIWEHMQTRNCQRINKTSGVLEQFRSFATGTNDKVNTDKRIRHNCVDSLYAVGEQRCLIATSHKFQNSIIATLKRDMEMGHEPTRRCNIFNYLVGQEIRLNRRNAVTVNTLDSIQSLDKVKECCACPFAIITDVDPGYHYFPSAFGSNLFGLSDKEINGS